MTPTAWRWALMITFAVQCAALYWPRTPSVASGLPLDKVVHVALFAAVAALGVLAGVPTGWLVAGLALQAVVSELVQGTMPGRSADGWDLLADGAGIAAGLAVGRWRALRQGTNPQSPSANP